MKIDAMDEFLPNLDVVERAQNSLRRFQSDDRINYLTDIESPEDFFLLTYFLNAQKKAGEIETFIRKSLNMSYVASTEDRGDAEKDGLYYEYKTSTSNFGRKLNIRQIRLWQDVDFYLCSYIDELDLSNSKCFRLTKDQMVDEVDRLGGFTHGTKNANAGNLNSEYSITIDPFSASNSNTVRWMQRYWYDELYDALNA